MPGTSDSWNGNERRQPGLHGSDRRMTPRHSQSGGLSQGQGGREDLKANSFHSVGNKTLASNKTETKGFWEVYENVPPVE